MRVAAAATLRTKLRPFSRILLQNGWNCQGCEGPFEVRSRPHRKGTSCAGQVP